MTHDIRFNSVNRTGRLERKEGRDIDKALYRTPESFITLADDFQCENSVLCDKATTKKSLS